MHRLSPARTGVATTGGLALTRKNRHRQDWREPAVRQVCSSPPEKNMTPAEEVGFLVNFGEVPAQELGDLVSCGEAPAEDLGDLAGFGEVSAEELGFHVAAGDGIAAWIGTVERGQHVALPPAISSCVVEATCRTIGARSFLVPCSQAIDPQ